jgi:hypothetical protein
MNGPLITLIVAAVTIASAALSYFIKSRRVKAGIASIFIATAIYVAYLAATADGYYILIPIFISIFFLIPAVVGSTIGFIIRHIQSRRSGLTEKVC